MNASFDIFAKALAKLRYVFVLHHEDVVCPGEVSHRDAVARALGSPRRARVEVLRAREELRCGGATPLIPTAHKQELHMPNSQTWVVGRQVRAEEKLIFFYAKCQNSLRTCLL